MTIKSEDLLKDALWTMQSSFFAFWKMSVAFGFDTKDEVTKIKDACDALHKKINDKREEGKG